MNTNIIRFLVLLVTIMFCGMANGQISVTGNGTMHVDTTNYISGAEDDLVYIISGNVGDTLEATLTATPKTGFDTALYTWSVFNSTTNSFDQVLDETSYSTNSQLTVSDSGGYQVRVYDTANSLDDTIMVWVFFSRLATTISIPEPVLCSQLTVLTEITEEPEDFVYYDQGSFAQLKFPYELEKTWEAETQEPYEGPVNIPNRVTFYDKSPPAVNTLYKVTVSNGFGFSVSDEELYETIHTYAKYDFTTEPDGLLYSYELAQGGNVEGYEHKSAPLQVNFTNKSVNAVDYKWIFVDASSDSSLARYYHPDSIVRYDTTGDDQRFTYLYVGKYNPILITLSEFGCPDTFPGQNEFSADQNQLEIEESQLVGANKPKKEKDQTNEPLKPTVPNVIVRGTSWTYFKPQNISLKEMHIRIYDRWGRKVHEATVRGNVDNWEGWDGTYKNGSQAPAGVYYYIFDAVGYEQPDPKTYEGERYKGFFHIIEDVGSGL